MRVSGLKDPSMLALAASTKTFSVYEPQIALGEKTYLSPIGPGSTERYLFILQDTLFQASDTVYIISYQPRSGRKFDALKGVLYVSTDGYALQNAIAEPVERAGNVSVKLQQQFAKVGGKAWFPVQLNTFLYFDGLEVNNFKVVGIGRTYLKDIRFDEPIAKREVRGPEFVMDRIATRRDDAFWDTLRTDALEEKELRTYVTIDSISEAENIERKIRWLGYLASGRGGPGTCGPAAGQGVRLQRLRRAAAGCRAGHQRQGHALRLARRLFRVWFWRQGLEVWWRPHDPPLAGQRPDLRTFYAFDVDESGGVAFQGPRRPFSSENYRMLYVDRMEQIERAGAELAFRVNSSLRMWVGTERADRTNLLGYRFIRSSSDQVTVSTDRFVTGVISVGLRFAFREQVASLPDRQFGLGTRWPVLSLNVWKAVPGLWEGELEIWRINAMIEKTFRLRMLGDLSIRAMGGMAEANAPYAFLYNLRGTFSTRAPIATQNTFETMRPNEFLADRYVALHVRHSFGNLLFKREKFRPVPVVVANAAWGALDKPEVHDGFTFSELNSGYYEAGLQIDNLLRSGFSSFGVGAFYRLGPNAFPDPLDNLAVKLTLGLGR
jgi:hypothetical protein